MLWTWFFRVPVVPALWDTVCGSPRLATRLVKLLGVSVQSVLGQGNGHRPRKPLQ